MGRPMTFRGRKPTSSSSSSSSSSSTGEFRHLLSVLYKVGFCFISKRRLLCKGAAIGSSRSDDVAVLDLSRASDEGVVKAGGYSRWPSRHVPEKLDSSEACLDGQRALHSSFDHPLVTFHGEVQNHPIYYRRQLPLYAEAYGYR